MNTVFKLDESGPSHFSQYGRAFQEKIFQGLITDQDWGKQMSEVMKPHFFDLKYIQKKSLPPSLSDPGLS